MSAVDSLYKTTRQSKHMRNSWRGLRCSMKNQQQLQLLLHLGEIRSDGTLIYGCTAGFMGRYIMQPFVLGIQQCKFHTFTGHLATRFHCSVWIIKLLIIPIMSLNSSLISSELRITVKNALAGITTIMICTMVYD